MENPRTAIVYKAGVEAGTFVQLDKHHFRFTYKKDYKGPPVSLTMPVEAQVYEYDQFPPFFDGVLPEGAQLDGLLKKAKLNARDYFGQLLVVGKDLVGDVTVERQPL